MPYPASEVPDAVLDALERILRDCDTVDDPRGLGQKRRSFAAIGTDREFLEARFELGVAAKLAREGEIFTFDASSKLPQPDFTLSSSGLGIETTTKAPEGVPELLAELHERLDGMEGAQVELVFSESATRIPQTTRALVIDDIAATLKSRADAVLRTPSRSYDQIQGVTNEIHAVVSPIAGSSVRIVYRVASAALQGPLEAATEFALSVAKDHRKLAQAATRRSILIVDVSRMGDVWLRPAHVWQSVIAPQLPNPCPWVAVGVAVSRLDDVDFELALVTAPDATAEEAAEVDRLRALFALPSTVQRAPGPPVTVRRGLFHALARAVQRLGRCRATRWGRPA